MNQKTKAVLAASAVAVAGLALLSVLFGSLGVLFPGRPDYTRWPAQTRIEMMPADSPEYLEKHYPGPNGKDLKTEIRYRNGDQGVKLYRADNTQISWDVTYKGGDQRLHVEYAKDGRQIVAGFERRDDRTLIWRAENSNNLVTTTTFYYDGTSKFSVVNQKIGDEWLDATYFRKSGKPWYHSLATRWNPDYAKLSELWDKDGNRVYVRSVNDKGQTIVSWYRADGTAAFEQTWVSYTPPCDYCGYMGGMGEYSPTPQTVLHHIDVYAADGKRVTMTVEQSVDGTRIESVTKIADDGTKSEGKSEDVTSEMQKALPKVEKPEEFWKLQEKDRSKRGDDAP